MEPLLREQVRGLKDYHFYESHDSNSCLCHRDRNFGIGTNHWRRRRRVKRFPSWKDSELRSG